MLIQDTPNIPTNSSNKIINNNVATKVPATLPISMADECRTTFGRNLTDLMKDLGQFKDRYQEIKKNRR